METLIALSLLVVVVLGMLMSFRQGSISQENFSSDHFTAMFLSQKILEDLNHRLMENPHVFVQLREMAATMEPQRVVNGESMFFKTLENTSGNDRILQGEDDPITVQQRSLYSQLERFRCQLTCGFVTNPERPGEAYPGLLEARVKVLWKDKAGFPREYVLNHLLHGSDPTVDFTTTVARVPEENAAAALGFLLDPDWNPLPTTIAEIVSRSGGGDPLVLRSLGSMLSIYGAMYNTIEYIDQEIASLTESGGNTTSTGQTGWWNKSVGNSGDQASIPQGADELPRLLEQVPATIFAGLQELQPEMATLQQCDWSANQLGPGLSAVGASLSAVVGWVASEAELFPVGAQEVEAAWNYLLDPAHAVQVSLRKRSNILRRWLESRKLLTLLAHHLGKSAETIRRDTADYLNRAKDVYRGRHTAFSEFLDTEQKVWQSVSALRASLSKVDQKIAGTIQVTHSLNTMAAKSAARHGTTKPPPAAPTPPAPPAHGGAAGGGYKTPAGGHGGGGSRGTGATGGFGGAVPPAPGNYGTAAD